MKILYLIPARGGSKGIPGKNIRPLNGKPLIYYSIQAAREVADDMDICISTDSNEIIEIVNKLGIRIPFKRPENLASDHTPMEEVIMHALDFYAQKGIEYDLVVLLQPTSPLREGKHIQEALGLFEEDIDMIVSAKKTTSNPYYVLYEEDEHGYLQKSKEGNYPRRQDCPTVWELNGAIYIINVKSLKQKGLAGFDKRIAFEMDRIHSIDIDEEIDFQIAELVMKNKAK